MSKETKPELDIQKKRRSINRADFCSDSLANASLSVQALHEYEVDVETLIKNFHFQIEKMLDGDMRCAEMMLITQAQTLDVLFHKMIQKTSALSLLSHIQGYMDIAFKAQKQCRQTLSALVQIKHPCRATFIKQQNNAVNQQVNNDISDLETSKKFENIANELLENNTYESMDTRTTITPVTDYSPVEAMEISGRENA